MIAFDPETHREPTSRELADHPYFQRGDRVVMGGTDLYGTVREQQKFVENPKVFVRWDYLTHEEGEASWVSPDHLALVAVRRR